MGRNTTGKPGVKPTVVPEDWIDAILSEMRRSHGVAFSVDKVAKKLGVTKGSFYNYFGSKRDAVEAALNAWAASENTMLDELERRPVGSAGDLVERFFSAVQSYEYPIVLFLLGLRQRSSHYREIALRIQAERFERALKLFRSFGLDEGQAERIAVYLLSVIIGMSYMEHGRLFELPSITHGYQARWKETTAIAKLSVERFLQDRGELP